MNISAVVDSSILRKGLMVTAGSKMLESFVAPFSATVVDKLEVAKVEIAGVVDTGEFGAGGLFGELQTVLTDAVKGVDVALCNDYTGAISRAAAAQGLYYIQPTYGTVSRYGLIPSVASMDQVGILCKCPEVGFKVLSIISGYDPKDGIMENATEHVAAGDTFLFHVSVQNQASPQRMAPPERGIKKYPLQQRDFEYSKILPQIMQILCCAELSNNISRYDGIKFGHRAKGYNSLRELYTKSRTDAFGEDVKLAAIIGAMVLSQENYTRYYDKAMRLRRMIKDSLDFDEYDVIVTDCPVLSRLCGLPSLTTPEEVYIANAGREDVLEAIAI